MPTPPTNVVQFADLLTKSGLVPAARVAAEITRWRKSHPEVAAAERDFAGFARALAAAKLVTPYQAALLLRGHAGGFTVGGYTILDRDRKTAALTVYRARHPSGQVVGLRVLPGPAAKNPHALDQFLREGRLLARLDHPHVVKAFESGRDRAAAFVATEYVPGVTLADVLARRGRLPAPEAVRLVTQALSGVRHLRDRAASASDLTPAGLLITPANEPTTLTTTLKIPFVSEANPVDDRGDILALGRLLFHLIAGRPAGDRPEPLKSLGVPIPPGLQEAFDRLTAADPAARAATPEAAADLLRAFLPLDGTDAPTSDMLPAFKEWLTARPRAEDPPDTERELVVEPVPARKARRAAEFTDVTVELVEDPRRQLLDRRDLAMLAAGGASVAGAFVAGYALSKLLGG